MKPNEILSSIAVQPISQPNPVLGTDGHVHFAYELLVVNPSKLFVTIDEVEALDNGGRSLGSLQGSKLARMITAFSGANGPLAPGESAGVFMDVGVSPDAAVPARISARVTISRQAVGPDGKPAHLPADTPLPAVATFTGAETIPGQPAATLDPPLRGPGWIAVNGCCDSITSHRGAIMAVNGALRVPERFAIDWVQLDSSNRVFTGNATQLSSYRYYGAPVYAVADGVVVNLYDDADEQVPNQPARNITPENIGGNMLVIDIGQGRYAFYAHLQKGSLKVALGDHVTAGQAVGLLANTGNSTAPHLHFHVMDRPSPLDANGLPYVFTKFRLRGVVEESGDNDPLEKGDLAKIDTTVFSGDRTNQLPLNNQVVDFE